MKWAAVFKRVRIHGSATASHMSTTNGWTRVNIKQSSVDLCSSRKLVKEEAWWIAIYIWIKSSVIQVELYVIEKICWKIEFIGSSAFDTWFCCFVITIQLSYQKYKIISPSTTLSNTAIPIKTFKVLIICIFKNTFSFRLLKGLCYQQTLRMWKFFEIDLKLFSKAIKHTSHAAYKYLQKSN